MCILLDDVDEPLLDDDEEPLDDELPDDDDDVVLSSSLSTSFFARRGLSLTPPRRGLSLMPRLSICNVVTGWSCAVAWFWGCLALWREPGLLTGWCRHSTSAALGLLPVPIDERVWRGLRSARTTLSDSSAVQGLRYRRGLG